MPLTLFLGCCWVLFSLHASQIPSHEYAAWFQKMFTSQSPWKKIPGFLPRQTPLGKENLFLRYCRTYNFRGSICVFVNNHPLFSCNFLQLVFELLGLFVSFFTTWGQFWGPGSLSASLSAPLDSLVLYDFEALPFTSFRHHFSNSISAVNGFRSSVYITLHWVLGKFQGLSVSCWHGVCNVNRGEKAHGG